MKSKKEEGYQNRYQNDVIGVFIDIFEHVLYLFLVFLLLTLSRYLFAGMKWAQTPNAKKETL